MLDAKRPFRLAAAVGLLTLTACGHSPETRFFTLAPTAPGRAAAAFAGPALRLDHVTIPPALDRPELVREYAAEQLKVDDFSHWGAPLGELMRATLVEDLTARLPAGRVVPASAPKLDGAVDLVVEVSSVHEGGGRVIADVDWILTRRPAGSRDPAQVVRTLRHERIEAALNGPSQQAYAAALSQVVGALADRIAEALGQPGGPAG